MKITSSGIVNGIIDKKYGQDGETNDFGMPVCSLPLKFEDAPEVTVSYAIFLEDKDAYPISGGFSWVHWLACDITKNEVLENESQNAEFKQGANSWISIQGGKQPIELCSVYGGMAPPDKTHTYEINVYALDCMLNLENGFLLNDMFNKMEGHILAHSVLKGKYIK